MFRATLKSLLSRKLRLVLSGLAIVLGVMFVSGSFVVSDAVSRTFDEVAGASYRNVDVVVSGPETAVGDTAPVPEAVLEQLRGMPQLAAVAGEISVDGARAIDNRTGRVVTVFAAQQGGNWVEGQGGVELREGRGPTADDEVAINAELARLGAFKVGDRIGVLTREPRRDFTVVGVFGYGANRDSLAGETRVSFTTPVAQQLMMGSPGMFTSVKGSAAPGVSPDDLRDAVAALLGDSLQTRTGEQAAAAESHQLREQLSVFTYILLGFAGVALFVGSFLVLNTFSIIVAQRVRELALLRAIGASREQVIGSVVLEAALIGLVASVVGLGLGLAVGAALAAAVGVSAGFVLPAPALFAAFGVGIGVTVGAALVPAVRAARVAPIAALREAATPDRPLTRLTVLGLSFLIPGAAALTFALMKGSGGTMLLLLLAGVLLAFIGITLLTPVLARPAVSVLGKLFAWSMPGELGRRNTSRNPRRTAVTAGALMVAVMLVTGASTVFSSLAATMKKEIGNDLGADVVIAGEQLGTIPPNFDPKVLDEARELPAVAGAVGFWYESVEIEDGAVQVTAIDDFPAWQRMVGLKVLEGNPDGPASRQLAVDDRTAERQQLSIGDRIDLRLSRDDKAHSYEVVSIYQRHDLLEGPLLSAQDAPGFGLPNPVEGFLDLRADADVAEVRGQVEGLLADSPEVVVQDRSSYSAQQTKEYDDALIYIQVLLVMAMIVAVLGVINTLVLSVIERTRELGLLRAIGLGRAATMRMITVEAVVISMFGALLGVAVGAGLGAAVVHALRDEGFSELTIPWGLMFNYVVAAAFVGTVAAVIPALRAARLNVLAAIAHE